MAEHIGVVNELRQMWQIVKRPEVAWLYARSSSCLSPRHLLKLSLSPPCSIPASLYAQFSSPYINSFFSVYFSVRARYVLQLVALHPHYSRWLAR